MRGDLKNAVGGGVDNGRAGAHVLRAQFFDNFRAGCRFVSQCAPADAPLELIHNLAREAMRIKRKRLFQMDPRHFPVAGGRIFSRRGQRASAICAGGERRGVEICEGLDVGEPEAAQIRQAQAAQARDVAERVTAHVAVIGGVRHGPDSQAVQHDPDHTVEHNSRVSPGTARHLGPIIERADVRAPDIPSPCDKLSKVVTITSVNAKTAGHSHLTEK